MYFICYNSKFFTNIFNLSLQNLNHHVSFTFWGPWYAQSLCFTFCLEGNGSIPAHSTNEDTEAWNVQVEAPLQTTLRLDRQVSWWVQTVIHDLWHLYHFSWHYWCGSQCLRLDTPLQVTKRAHHPIALPLSLEQNRMVIAAAPGWTSRDAKWKLN